MSSRLGQYMHILVNLMSSVRNLDFSGLAMERWCFLDHDDGLDVDPQISVHGGLRASRWWDVKGEKGVATICPSESSDDRKEERLQENMCLDGLAIPQVRNIRGPEIFIWPSPFFHF